MEISDTKEFFNAAKKSNRMIVHFYRSVTPRCQIVDAHFERLCQTHLEARFVKIDAEKSPYLVEKLGIILMPTIVLIKDGKTEHAIHGFDEFGGTDDFTTQDMAYVLATHKVLNYETDRSEEISQRATRAGLNSVRLATIRSGDYDHQSDDDLFEED
jgi:thiol-disulfide isomerase/thioredoxin